MNIGDNNQRMFDSASLNRAAKRALSEEINYEALARAESDTSTINKRR